MSRYDDHTEQAERDYAANTRADRAAARAYAKASRPWYRRKRVLIPAGMAALFLIVTIANAGSAPTTPAQTGSGSGTMRPIAPTSSDPVDAPPPVTDEDVEAKLTFGAMHTGDDGLQLTVTAPKVGNATLGAAYCTQVSYVNGTDDAVPFNVFDWKLVDTEGVEASTGFKGYGTDAGLGSGELRPGGKKTGTVCFDKQGAGTPAEIIYQGGLFGQPVVWVKG